MFQLNGWLLRAAPYPSSQNFMPTLDDLVLASFISFDDQEQLILTLFKPNIAVDKNGKVMVIKSEDFDDVLALVQKTVEISQPKNIWRMAQPNGGDWIENLWVKVENGMTNVQVVGFAQWTTALEVANHGTTSLPGDVFKLFSLLEEGKLRKVEGIEEGLLASIQSLIEVGRGNGGGSG